MLKLILLVLEAIIICTSGYLIKVPTNSLKPQTGQAPVQKQEWVFIQNRMMPLFENVCEESTNPLIIDLSNEFANDFGNENFWDPEVVTRLQNYKNKNGFLPKGEIFTEFNQEHIAEVKLIYETLYFAKDFATFYKAAAWSRQNINCGLYVDAIYLAILNRKDTERLSIPPPFEILPNYFINKDAIIEGSLLLSNQEFIESENIREEGNSYIIDASYSDGYYENNVESLAYFHEDIGLNSYYFIQKIKMSPWLNVSSGIKPNYGENIYHTMKQLSTRYNLERYSNGLTELDDFNWNEVSFSTYNPMLIYSNGQDFSQSCSKISPEDNENVIVLQNIETNIETVASHMRERGYNRQEILNHLMEILVTNSNSYENLALKILTSDYVLKQSAPSALAHYLTIIRDPIFWKINKKLVGLIDSALAMLPGYVRNDIIFPGVEIVNVDVKKMLTSFDYYEFDVTDALKTSTAGTKFQAKIGQYRLNHNPFSIKLNISSLVTQKGYAKIFIGPKVLPGEFAEMKNLFFLLDSFEISLKKGKNIITRSSNDMNLSKDLISLKEIKKRLEDAEFGLDALSLETIAKQTEFPLRLTLPKGSKNGLTFQIFVLISPYIKPSVGGSLTNLEYNLDAILNPGFPLDLNIEMHQVLDLPNAIIKDFIITHKVENKQTKEVEYETVDTNTMWTSSERETPNRLLKLSARPEFTKKNESFDYKSKRGQYGKKDDYSAKRGGYNKGKNNMPTIPIEENKVDLNKSKSLEEIEIEILKYLPINSNDVNKTLYKVITDTTISEKTIKSELDDEKTPEPKTSKEVVVDVVVVPHTVEAVKPNAAVSDAVGPDGIVELPQKKVNPTIYDFLFSKSFDVHTSEEKVYE